MPPVALDSDLAFTVGAVSWRGKGWNLTAGLVLVVLSVLMGRCTSARVGPPLAVLVNREVNRAVRIEAIVIVNWSIGCDCTE